MAEVTLDLIKTLREKTNAGMMDCKGALVEAEGDIDKAETILRKKGIADASKKASRSAKEGVVASYISGDKQYGVLVEVNCETDFVAKNENFQSFVQDICQHIAEKKPTADTLLSQPFFKEETQTIEDVLKAKISELGENMRIRRFVIHEVGKEKQGVVASYIHLQGKVGVVLTMHSESAEIIEKEIFQTLVKDLTLHIAASQPLYIRRDEVEADTIEAEKEVYRAQLKDKPDNIMEKILEGKIDKYFGTICLLEQGFVKDPDQTVGELIVLKGKELGAEISVAGFTRYAVGEEV